jgi:hypothetical protein
LPKSIVSSECSVPCFGVTYEARSRKTGAHVVLKEYMPSRLCTRPPGSTGVTPAQGPAVHIVRALLLAAQLASLSPLWERKFRSLSLSFGAHPAISDK